MIAVGALCGACGSEPAQQTGAADESTNEVAVRTRPGSADISILARAVIEEACSATVCFDVESTKTLSAVAVQAATCAGATVEARLYLAKPDDYVPVEAKPIEVAENAPCPAMPAGTLAFYGLASTHYIVCAGYSGVSSAGDITLHAAAGATCATGATVPGTCQRCPARGSECDTTAPCLDGSHWDVATCGCVPDGGGDGGAGSDGGRGGEGGEGGCDHSD